MLSVRVAGVSGRLPQLQRLTVVRPTLLRRWYGDAAKESAPLAQRYPRTFPSAVKRVLPMLCERGSWNYAEAWVKDAEADGGIKCIATFSDDAVAESAVFREGAAAAKYSIGDGSVGKAWELAKPEWLTNVMTHAQSPASDFKNGLVVPAIVDNEVQAVLAFYSKDAEWPTTEIIDDFAALTGPLMHTTLTAGDVKPKLEAIDPKALRLGGENAKLERRRTQEQMDAVFDEVVGSGVFTAAAVYEDVSYFFNTLGLPADYFDRYEVFEIAQHVTAFMSAKKLAAAADPQTGRDMKQEQITASVMTSQGHCFMIPHDRKHVKMIEKQLDDMRSAMNQDEGMSVARYMSEGPAVPYGSKELCVYVVDIEPYVTPPNKLEKGLLENDIKKVATAGFLAKADNFRTRYQDLIVEKQSMLRPLTKIGEPLSDGTIPVVIGMRSTTDGKMSTRGMNELITECIGKNILVRRKYFTTFANGLIFYSLYLDPVPVDEIREMLKRVNLLTMLPRESCMATLPLVTTAQKLLPEEYSYSVCATNFAFYFLQSDHPDLEALANALSGDKENATRLKRVAYRLRQQAVPMSRIDECINQYPHLVKALYGHFETIFSPTLNANGDTKPQLDKKLLARIDKEVVDEVDRLILRMFATFNKSVAKTNFYNTRKSTLAFRLEPKEFFSGLTQFETTPYGITMILSNDFRGFHVRFMPVARGGLRLIRSETQHARFANMTSLFKENYSLALTQNKKNKDIPEFGSKGTILLEPLNQSDDAGRYAFMKYISGMMDILLPTPGEMIDHHGKEEIIFFGPDEGTANYMDDAAYYAKGRNYKYWSACTTGKPPQMGGIPHDTYGMTTRSVHQFVLGALEKAGLHEEDVTKLQTGGPDGDLGSNEIKISKDKTIGIVDGSGVLFDPNGLNRDALEEMVEKRCMVKKFDQRALSPDGMFVSVDDKEKVLPDGTIIESGLAFRNEFHFHPLGKADLFVPCGGRPEAINGMNVHRLIDADGGNDHQFKYIVEGANLFITEDARDVLENHGIVLYKDASTNKGGVTSSSFEVLASLCMTDEEHAKHMRADETGKILPEFYSTYVNEIIEIIENNARLEFEAVHDFATKTGTTRSLTTDILSNKINDLNSACQNSELWEDQVLRREVLKRALPKTLQRLLTLDVMIERLPEDYLKAVFGYYIASRFVYTRGMDTEGFEYLTAFFGHMADFTRSGRAP